MKPQVSKTLNPDEEVAHASGSGVRRGVAGELLVMAWLCARLTTGQMLHASAASPSCIPLAAYVEGKTGTPGV
jgi:hypothetical protein